MKHHILGALLACGLLGGSLSWAQDVPAEIFDKAGCGCDLDTSRFKNSAYILDSVDAKFKAGLPKIKASFSINGTANAVAVDIITRLERVRAASDYEDALGEIQTQLSAKDKSEADFPQKLTAQMRDLMKGGFSLAWNRYAICFFAERMHAYYLRNPQDAAEKHQEIYKSFNLAKNPEPEPVVAGKPKDEPKPEPKSEEGGGGYFVWILLGISILGNVGLLMRKPSAAPVQLPQADPSAELRRQLAEANRAKDLAEAQNRELSAQVQSLESRLKAAQSEIKPIVVTNNPENSSDQQHGTQTQPANQLAIKYLYAPSRDGIFFSNSVKDARDGNAFFSLRFKNEHDPNPILALILEKDILRRAESLGLEPLLPVCELRGVGRIPQEMSQIRMTEGVLRREGQGWRVQQKIVLEW